MADPYPAPDATPPLRVLILGASGPGWYAASQQERAERILPRLAAVFAAWTALGARLIVTLDDDLLKVGQPADHDHTWYLVYDVPDLQTVSTMLHQFRLEVDGARLDRWFRLEAKVCRPFFPAEAVAQP
ncbi:MAG TPA: hypothetical protein PK812_04430 [Beijerinckiaceae bacterium]|nr:hypothetical protein [Beijerinckiaceae bacterium]